MAKRKVNGTTRYYALLFLRFLFIIALKIKTYDQI